MPYPQFTNDFTGQLASGYTAGGTSLVLLSTSGLPTTGNFVVRVDSGSNAEYFLITANNTGTNTLTGVGAQGGTANISHGGGVLVTGCWIIPDILDRFNESIGNILSQSKMQGVKGSNKGEYVLFNLGSSPVTILSYSGGPGYIDMIWFAGESQVYPVTIDIYIDGSGTPTISCLTSELFFNYQAGAAFLHDWFSFAGGESCFIPIPFTSQVVVKLSTAVNVGSPNLWYWITYQKGPPNKWPYTQKLFNAVLNDATVSYNTTKTLLNYTGGKPGRLVGILMFVDPASASSSQLWMEGNWKIYIDGNGSPDIETPGTEDLFLTGGYFAFVSQGALSEQTGITQKTVGNKITAFRLFLRDPIKFESQLKITHDIGGNGFTFTGTVSVHYSVLYYLEN